MAWLLGDKKAANIYNSQTSQNLEKFNFGMAGIFERKSVLTKSSYGVMDICDLDHMADYQNCNARNCWWINEGIRDFIRRLD